MEFKPTILQWGWACGILGLSTLALAMYRLITPDQVVTAFGLMAISPTIRTAVLTDPRWHLAQGLVAGLACAWLVAGLWLSSIAKVGHRIARYLQQAYIEARMGKQALRRHWSVIPAAAQWLLCLLSICIVIYWGWAMMRLPLTYDEIFSYLNFSLRGPLVAITYYPVPNNHIFYNLIASFTVACSPNPLIGMRLPALLGAIVTLGLLSILLWRNTKSAWGTLGGILLYSSLYGVFSYSFMGRGYGFLLLAFVGSLGCTLELLALNNPYRRVAWVGFIVFSVIGLYTIPTYIYPFGTQTLLLAAVSWHRRKTVSFTWKEPVSAFIVIGVVISFLYTLIILFSSPTQLFHNRFVVHIGRSEVVQQLPQLIAEIAQLLFNSSLFTIIALGLAGAGLVSAWGRYAEQRLVSLGLYFIMPVMFMLLQGVVPPARTWIYLAVVMVLLATVGLTVVARLIPSYLFKWLGAAALVGLWSYNIIQLPKRFHSDSDIYYSYEVAMTYCLPNVPLVADPDWAELMLQYQHHLLRRPFNMLPYAALSTVSERTVVVHDKLSLEHKISQDSEPLTLPGRYRRLLYEDKYVRVSEWTSATSTQ